MSPNFHCRGLCGALVRSDLGLWFTLTDMPFQMHIMIFYHKLCKNYKVSPVNLGKVGLPGPAPFTIRHFLLECGDFAQERNNCFHVDNMK